MGFNQQGQGGCFVVGREVIAKSLHAIGTPDENGKGEGALTRCRSAKCIERIRKTIRWLVAKDAGHCCEYCGIHYDDTFCGCEVDHVVSRKLSCCVLPFLHFFTGGQRF